MLFSSPYGESYMKQHVLSKNGMSFEETGRLAASRLEWLLHQTRHSLKNTFTRADFQLMASCFMGDIFYPDQLDNLASDLCDEHGLDMDQLRDGPFTTLVFKLADLTPLERVALADALEQAWYRQSEAGPDYFEVLAELGFDLG